MGFLKGYRLALRVSISNGGLCLAIDMIHSNGSVLSAVREKKTMAGNTKEGGGGREKLVMNSHFGLTVKEKGGLRNLGTHPAPC